MAKAGLHGLGARHPGALGQPQCEVKPRRADRTTRPGLSSREHTEEQVDRHLGNASICTVVGVASAGQVLNMRLRQPASSLMFASLMILRYSATCSFQ